MKGATNLFKQITWVVFPEPVSAKSTTVGCFRTWGWILTYYCICQTDKKYYMLWYRSMFKQYTFKQWKCIYTTSLRKDSLAPHIGNCLLSISSSLAWLSSCYVCGNREGWAHTCSANRDEKSPAWPPFSWPKCILCPFLEYVITHQSCQAQGWYSLEESEYFTLGNFPEKMVFYHLISSSSYHLKPESFDDAWSHFGIFTVSIRKWGVWASYY